MKRREFIAALAGAAAAPIAGSARLLAQPADRPRRIGVLMARHETDSEGQKQALALRQGLRDLGWKLGQTLQIEYRWTVGDMAKALSDAQELAALKPDVLVANGTPSLRAMQRATATIPIVFVSVADPLGQGFVPSLARPGGHITGFSVEEASMGGKWLDYLKEAAPRVSHVSVIFNPDTAPYAAMFRPTMEAATQKMGMTLTWSPVHVVADIDRVAATAAATPNGSLLVVPDSFTFSQRDTLIGAAARHRLPAIYPIRFFTVGGGLVAYGIDRIDLFRRSADYIDRIIKGANPGDLPVQQPTKFELAINLKTAKTLDLTIPQSLLLSADDVIE